MNWNYRVIRHISDGCLMIHEVYYSKKGKPEMMTENPSYPSGETLKELQEDLDIYLIAMGRPVLDEKDIG